MEAATCQSIQFEDIKQKLKEKMCLNHYSTFLPNVNTNNEVEKFLLDPICCYDSKIYDVFLLALGKYIPSKCKNLLSKYKRMLGY